MGSKQSPLPRKGITMESNLQAFQAGYVEAMLWANTYNSDGEPEDNARGMEVAEDALKQMHTEAAEFYEANLAPLTEAVNAGRPWDHLGHDLALTRNHHGAGFWDRGLGELGDHLTEMAHPMGEAHLYVGDDGLVHHE